MTARILIVDDDPDTAEQLVRFVASDASETRVVTESSKAERAFEEFEPDLALLDLHMPDPEGSAEKALAPRKSQRRRYTGSDARVVDHEVDVQVE